MSVIIAEIKGVLFSEHGRDFCHGVYHRDKRHQLEYYCSEVDCYLVVSLHAVVNVSCAVRRLLSLVMDKILAAGVVAEDVALAIVDSVMSTAIDFLQKSRRLLPDNNLVTAK